MDKKFVTRQEVRQMGLNVSNTQFLRYEMAGLLNPIKIGGLRSAVVRYSVEQVAQLLSQRGT